MATTTSAPGARLRERRAGLKLSHKSQLRQKPRGRSRRVSRFTRRPGSGWRAPWSGASAPASATFNDEEEAGRAYDRAVCAAEPGAFANFPIEDYPDLAAARVAPSAGVQVIASANNPRGSATA